MEKGIRVCMLSQQNNGSDLSSAAPIEQQQQQQQQQKQIRPKYASKTIWFRDLQPWMDEDYLYNQFYQTGEVSSVKVFRSKKTGQPKGYGCIEFHSHYTADVVFRTYNGSKMPFTLTWESCLLGEDSDDVTHGFLSQADSSTSTTIAVGGIESLFIHHEDLLNPFSKFGEVLSVTIPAGRGCCFVQFANRKCAEDAMQNLNGTSIGNQKLLLSWDLIPVN